jgi:DNA-binding response OmpR family regulator
MMAIEAARPWIRQLLVSHGEEPDDSDWVGGLTSYLEPRRVGVHRAFTGQQTIGLVKRGGIDAAVLSCQLPRMDGLSVLRIIRSIDADLPCVMVTADASKRTLQRALELQAYTVLTRPVNLTALTRVLAGLFRNRFDCRLD